MDIPEFILVVRQSLHRVLHQHLSIDLVHDHHSWIVNGILLRMRFLSKQVVIDAILMAFVIMVDMLSEFVEEEDELLLVDGLFYDDVGVLGRRLEREALLSRHQEQLVEMLQGRTIRDQASVHHKLSVLAEPHSVGLRFGEIGPQLSEPIFVVLFQYNRL